jgi:hypothetical protein
MTSPKFSFEGRGKAILMSLGLSLLTALATWLVALTDNFDFGAYAPLIGSLAVFAANSIREFIQEKS